MTRKELILRFLEKLPDDVSYDQVIYHLDVMRAAEEGTEQMKRGEWIDHDELFAELLGEEAEGEDSVVSPSKARSADDSGAHRPNRTPGRGRVRKKA
jgi:hypothetical protein